ncbi:Hint domain-containing protein [Phaeovulum sp. W22_SRMD_FR3]|uniref:Hint domain-containing protein n=1 Tax=Phaeovulum sp. W22_SRMD_FR3 TaxID=3240274 RepID=UPI003F9E50B9
MTLGDMRMQTAGLQEARDRLGGVFDASPAPVTRLIGDLDAGPLQVHSEAEGGAALWQGDCALLMAAIPCFTPGTTLASQRGMIAVEDLQPGDQLVTRDNGLQPLLWSGRRRFDWRMLGMNPVLRPIEIAAGALAPGLPLRKVLVSPNHRLLTRAPEAGHDEGGERLIEARAMVGQPGITRAAVPEVSYVQLLFARHELLLGEGIWSESFQPDALRLLALGEEGLADFLAHNPEFMPDEAGCAAPAYASARPHMNPIAEWDQDRREDGDDLGQASVA